MVTLWIPYRHYVLYVMLILWMDNGIYGKISLILRSPLNKKILECLAESDRPLTPKQIGKIIGLAGSNVSTKFKMLRKRNLVECLNPEDRKWRFYSITDQGKEILKEAKKYSDV